MVDTGCALVSRLRGAGAVPMIRCPRCHASVRLIDGKIRPHHISGVDKIWVLLERTMLIRLTPLT